MTEQTKCITVNYCKNMHREKNALRKNGISDWATRIRPNIRRPHGYAATWYQPSEGAKRRPTNKTEATIGAAQAL